jgi:hypothetical protein
MRGDDRQQGEMFSYASPEQKVSADRQTALYKLLDGPCIIC